MDLMDAAFPSDAAWGSLLKHHEGLPLDPLLPEAPTGLVPPGQALGLGLGRQGDHCVCGSDTYFWLPCVRSAEGTQRRQRRVGPAPGGLVAWRKPDRNQWKASGGQG